MAGNAHSTRNGGQFPCLFMANHRFPKGRCLLNGKDFERVFAERSSAGDAWIVLYGAANQLGHPRLGLAVSRRIGNATQRNRWKRLLREAFRLKQHELPPCDFVCIPRPLAPPSLRQLSESVLTLAGRIGSRLGQRQPTDRQSRDAQTKPDSIVAGPRSGEA